MCKNLNKEPLDIRSSYCEEPRTESNEAPREVVVKFSASLVELALVGFLAIVGAGFYLLRGKLKGLRWK